MKFLLLLYGDEAAEAALTPGERRAIVERHIEWSRLLRDHGVLVSSEALAPATEAVTVRRGGRMSDGPFAETKEQVGGFYLLECESRDQAVDYARMAPESPGLVVEIRPIAPM
jgi:hypothetical protein